MRGGCAGAGPYTPTGTPPGSPHPDARRHPLGVNHRSKRPHRPPPACTHTHTCTRAHRCAYTHAHAYAHTCTHAHAYTCAYTRARTCAHAHGHTHTCTHAHTFMKISGGDEIYYILCYRVSDHVPPDPNVRALIPSMAVCGDRPWEGVRSRRGPGVGPHEDIGTLRRRGARPRSLSCTQVQKRPRERTATCPPALGASGTPCACVSRAHPHPRLTRQALASAGPQLLTTPPAPLPRKPCKTLASPRRGDVRKVLQSRDAAVDGSKGLPPRPGNVLPLCWGLSWGLPGNRGACRGRRARDLLTRDAACREPAPLFHASLGSSVSS